MASSDDRALSKTSLVVGLGALLVAAIVLLDRLADVHVDGLVVLAVLLVVVGGSGLARGVVRLRHPRGAEGVEQVPDA